MRLSIFARFTLKDLPKGYLGLRGEDWNFGKNERLSFSEMMMALYRRVADMYLIFEDGPTMIQEHKKLCARLNAIEFRAAEEVKVSAGD